jgi:hypothetical protein
MKPSFKIAGLGAALLLAGCVSLPTGPSVMALPGTGRTFDQFRADDLDCRVYANHQTGISPNDSAVNSGVASAAVGTAIGALAGAAIGGSSGAATGAGVGLIGGSMYGASTAYGSQYASQRAYDNSYVQCMYAKGHKVPTSGYYGNSRSGYSNGYSSAPAAAVPPPPPGSPPPPPPGVR